MARARPRHRRHRRRWWRGVAAALALLLVGVLHLLRDPEPYFLARRSHLAGVDVQPPVVEDGFVLHSARLTAASGLVVELSVRRARADGTRRLPLVVILGGHRTGRDAVRLLGSTRGAVVAALSYPFTGHARPDPLTFAREIPRIRQAFLDTPPALMLALDYLLALPGIDPARVELVGVSLGAPFACISGALDRRYTRVWAVHGSGGSFRPLEKVMRRKIKPAPVRWVAAGVANVVIAGPRLAPQRWVARISPRPFVMVNATGDEWLPRDQIERLYASARDPKEMIWMTGAHVRADHTAIRPLVQIVLTRVLAASRRRPRSGARVGALTTQLVQHAEVGGLVDLSPSEALAEQRFGPVP